MAFTASVEHGPDAPCRCCIPVSHALVTCHVCQPCLPNPVSCPSVVPLFPTWGHKGRRQHGNHSLVDHQMDCGRSLQAYPAEYGESAVAAWHEHRAAARTIAPWFDPSDTEIEAELEGVRAYLIG